MNIYKIKYTIDLVSIAKGNNKIIDTDGREILVSATSLEKAMLKTGKHAKKENRDFNQFTVKDEKTGETAHYKYTNFEIASCELVAESEI